MKVNVIRRNEEKSRQEFIKNGRKDQAYRWSLYKKCI